MTARPAKGPQPLGFESLAIHAGQAPDPSTGAVVTPVFQTSTYAQSGVGQHLGYDYSRTANPHAYGTGAVPGRTRKRRPRVGVRQRDGRHRRAAPSTASGGPGTYT